LQYYLNAKITAFEYLGICYAENLNFSDAKFVDSFYRVYKDLSPFVDVPVNLITGNVSFKSFHNAFFAYFMSQNKISLIELPTGNIFSLSIYLVIILIMMNLCFKLTAAPFHL